MVPELASYLASPTPVASLVTSIAALIVLGIVFLVVRYSRRPHWYQILPPNSPKAETTFDRIIERAGALDRTIVRVGSRITGTRYQSPVARRLQVVAVFTGSAVIGAISPPFL